MRAMTTFFRANPQAFVLLVICLVLGVGTFVAVLISIAGSSSASPSGDPSGAIDLAGPLLGHWR